jgi:hypothetical protein
MEGNDLGLVFPYNRNKMNKEDIVLRYLFRCGFRLPVYFTLTFFVRISIRNVKAGRETSVPRPYVIIWYGQFSD